MDSLGATVSSTLNRGPNSGYSLSKKQWSTIGQISSVLQIALGVILFLMASAYLTHMARGSGQLIGILSIVFGAFGFLGLRTKGTPLQMLFIVGMGFMAVMTFEFTVQVGRDVEFHCSLAESFTRLNRIETTITSMKHNELVSQLFVRMNEMDDMLTMVESGSVDKLHTKWKKESLIQQDAEYISAKIQSLKKHAENVLDHILKEAENASDKEKELSDKKLIMKQKELQKTLMARVEKVEDLLDVLEEKEESNELITYEEFESLFNALSGVHMNPKELEKEKATLGVLKGAMKRMETGEHHQTGTSLDKDNALQKHRDEKRAQFESTFHKTLSEHSPSTPSQFQAALYEDMKDLPEHCLEESDRYIYFLYGGWTLIISQMIAAYLTATSLFLSNIKKDY
eukprot:g7185.t1